MAVTPTPAFIQTIRGVSAVATAAKTTYSDSTNAVQLVAGGTNGSVLRLLTAIPRATVTATQLQLYRSPDAGTTMYFVKTKLMAAYTMAQTTDDTLTDFGFTDTSTLWIPSGTTLWVGIGVVLAGGIVFNADVGDL